MANYNDTVTLVALLASVATKQYNSTAILQRCQNDLFYIALSAISDFMYIPDLTGTNVKSEESSANFTLEVVIEGNYTHLISAYKLMHYNQRINNSYTVFNQL